MFDRTPDEDSISFWEQAALACLRSGDSVKACTRKADVLLLAYRDRWYPGYEMSELFDKKDE